MGYFSKQISNVKNGVSEDLMTLLGINAVNIDKNKLSEITYFTSLKLLSESMGKIPLKLYQNTDIGSRKAYDHYLYQIIKIRPNPYSTAFSFWSAVEINRNHFGNAYVFVDVYRGKVRGLYLLPNSGVQVYNDNAGIFSSDYGIWYVYTDKDGKQYKFTQDQIMHFKSSVSFDGINGLSVQECLRVNLENAQSGQSYVNTYFKSGLSASGLLQYTGDIQPNEREAMQAKFSSMASGIKNAGKIVPMPLGFSFQQLKNTLVDSQFLELNKYTALQIAAALGIKPSMLNDYSANYGSVESMQTAFWIDTLMPIVTQYEQEIMWKLLTSKERQQGYYAKYNVDVLMRATYKERWEGHAFAINNGAKTPNEIREIEDDPKHPDGDQLIVNGNYIPLKDAGMQYRKGGE